MKSRVFLVVALIALTTTAVFAQTEADFEVEDSKDGKSVEIWGYRGNATAVVIPANIQGKPVTAIMDGFIQNRSITSVAIPRGVTYIEEQTFMNCTSLTSVTIPTTVTDIGRSAFQGCTSLENIVIPNSVKTIRVRTFSGCSKLDSAIIPDSVQTIEMSAFERCSGITGITIGRGVTKIEPGAFLSCTKVQQVIFRSSIPSSSFAADAFIGLGLREKFYETDKTNGTAGTYLRPDGTGTVWTKR